MKPAQFLLLVIGLCVAGETGAAKCPPQDWQEHANQCVLLVSNDPKSYEEAKKECENKKASLVTVRNPEMQTFLDGITGSGYHDPFWLGGKHNDGERQFFWENMVPITYENWAPGYPKMNVASNTCMILKPPGTRSTDGGNWEHIPCAAQKSFICQKAKELDSDELSENILKLQSDIENLRLIVSNNSQDVDALTTVTDKLKENAVPLGMIYIEYHNQNNPYSLWPSFTWKDVTQEYEGLFFRALGGNSNAWGATQDDCTPRITKMQYQHPTPDQLNSIDIPAGGISQYGVAGYHSSSTGSVIREGLRFHTANCEVRPKNQAIRIWKRV